MRRRLAVRRADGVEVTLVAARVVGEGVATSLVVESIRLLDENVLRRSGVHSRAEVEATLAQHDESGPNPWAPSQPAAPLLP